jgi:hypothetical protein
MAKATGISVGSVQRIWQAHKLQPHRLRTFKRSRDPSFAAKLADIVGLYIDPPAHATGAGSVSQGHREIGGVGWPQNSRSFARVP